MGIVASDFSAVGKNTLKGVVTLTLVETGLVIKGCLWHEKNGKEWVALPGAPRLTGAGQVQRDPATSKVVYNNLLAWSSRERSDTFQRAAIKAIYRLLNQPTLEDEARAESDKDAPAWA